MPDDARVPAYGLYVRVQERLALTGMTKTDLRKKTGVARSTIDSWATQATPPQARTVNKVADALGIDRMEALRLAGILDTGPADGEPQIVPLDAFERAAMAADRPYAERVAAIMRHREILAEELERLGITEVPDFVRRAVRRRAGDGDDADARDARPA
jgi:transcriptional regulator with XRE-family HTH domain